MFLYTLFTPLPVIAMAWTRDGPLWAPLVGVGAVAGLVLEYVLPGRWGLCARWLGAAFWIMSGLLLLSAVAVNV